MTPETAQELRRLEEKEREEEREEERYLSTFDFAAAFRTACAARNYTPRVIITRLERAYHKETA
jgi:hypothetical protein